MGNVNSSSNYSFWNIEYYSKYFNVDTKDVRLILLYITFGFLIVANI